MIDIEALNQEIHIESQFIEKLNTYPIRYIHNYSRGDLTERIKDSLMLKTFFIRFFTRILIDSFVSLYSLCVLFIIDWKISLIVIAILSIFICWFWHDVVFAIGFNL